MSGEIIVRGKPHRCLVPVKLWTETGMHFLTRTRVHPTRWVINHWTASENTADQVFSNMRNHRNRTTRAPEPLSVHFIVDQLGTIFQCADTEARCAHAKANGGNAYGIGIEIINRGHDKRVPAKGFIRAERSEMIHGQLVTYGEFFPAQIGAVIALNAALCQAYELPMRVPVRDGEVYPTVLPIRYLESYRGVLGHLHLEAGKPDPGLDVLRKVHEAGIQFARS